MSETVINEKDKPFIIAIYLITILAVIFCAGLIGAFYDKQLILDYIGQIVGGIITLVTAAVTFYFGTKNNNK